LKLNKETCHLSSRQAPLGSASREALEAHFLNLTLLPPRDFYSRLNSIGWNGCRTSELHGHKRFDEVEEVGFVVKRLSDELSPLLWRFQLSIGRGFPAELLLIGLSFDGRDFRLYRLHALPSNASDQGTASLIPTSGVDPIE
jgi:hypothetical protein